MVVFATLIWVFLLPKNNDPILTSAQNHIGVIRV